MCSCDMRRLPPGEDGRRRLRVESARRRVECRPKSVLMPKVLTSLSDRGRCNRNNNSNSNNHAAAPRRYQLIALLGIKASSVCASACCPAVHFTSRKGIRIACQVYILPPIDKRQLTIQINILYTIDIISLLLLHMKNEEFFI